MNILLLIGIIFALSGFKPVSTEKGQATQGYYKPRNHPKLKMNTSANLGDMGVGSNWKGVEPNTYFRADRFFMGVTSDMVFRKVGTSSATGVGEWNPMNYTTENKT